MDAFDESVEAAAEAKEGGEEAQGDGYLSDPFDEQEREEDVVQVLSSGGSGFRSRKRERFSSGTPSAMQPPSQGSTPFAPSAARHHKLNEKINALRFHNQRTAFDVDIDTLPEQPWRKPHTDYSDYFNFGFTEDSWMAYCEKQLRIRSEMGQGPVRMEPAPSHLRDDSA